MTPSWVQLDRERTLEDFRINADKRWGGNVTFCIKCQDVPNMPRHIGGAWQIISEQSLGM